LIATLFVSLSLSHSLPSQIGDVASAAMSNLPPTPMEVVKEQLHGDAPQVTVDQALNDLKHKYFG
ncbi:hypothetical protein ACXWQS_09365, partial [Streptococcus pyogenes]